MDKISLIKREANKLVAKDKQVKESIKKLQEKEKELKMSELFIDKKLRELDEKKEQFRNKEIGFRNNIEKERMETTELNKRTASNLKQTEEANNALGVKGEEISKQIKSLDGEKQNLIIKKDNLDKRKLKLDEKEKENTDYNEKLRILSNNTLEETEKLDKTRLFLENKDNELNKRELAINTKFGTLKDRESFNASRELELKNFVQRLKTKHGLAKLKKEGLL